MSTNQNSCILLVVMIIKIVLAMHGNMNIKFSGNFLPTFRYNKSVPLIQNLEIGLMVCPEVSVRNYHYSLRNNTEERSSHLLRGES